MAELETTQNENVAETSDQNRHLTMVAALRSIGDSRRQRLLTHLGNRLKIVSVPVELPPMSRYLNLIRTISPRKALWRDRSKRSAYYFREASRALAGVIEKRTGGSYDLILLFEALYAPGVDLKACKPYLVYEDSTLALALKVWPDWVPDVARNPEYRRLESEYYRHAARILTSNERTRQSLICDYEIPPDKIITIGQGCDFSPAPGGEVDRIPGLIMFVGYDFERKGGRCLIEAFRNIKQTHPKARLLIVGSKVRVNEPGVEVIGPVRDKTQLSEMYRRANAFVLPAIYDPMPHAAMEAMLSEVPVVMSTECGTSEIIEDGINGFVVPPGNSQALAVTLIRLLDDSHLSQKVGQAGAQLLKSKYTWEQVSTRIHQIVLEVLNEKNGQIK